MCMIYGTPLSTCKIRNVFQCSVIYQAVVDVVSIKLKVKTRREPCDAFKPHLRASPPPPRAFPPSRDLSND